MTTKIESTKNNETNELHLSDRFPSAIDYAQHIHIERRKGTGIPYMAHLLGVASLVMGEAGQVGFPVTEDMVIAALLHDAAEDHGATVLAPPVRALLRPVNIAVGLRAVRCELLAPCFYVLYRPRIS